MELRASIVALRTRRLRAAGLILQAEYKDLIYGRFNINPDVWILQDGFFCDFSL